MVLRGTDPFEVAPGNIIVYNSIRADPIIHRVVKVWKDNGYHYQTKGDNVDKQYPYKVRFENIKRVLVAIIY